MLVVLSVCLGYQSEQGTVQDNPVPSLAFEAFLQAEFSPTNRKEDVHVYNVKKSLLLISENVTCVLKS